MKHGQNRKVFLHVQREEYCCVNGYLRLCKARGETVAGMAETAGVSKGVMYSYFRDIQKHPCQKQKDCLTSIISEIEQSKF